MWEVVVLLATSSGGFGACCECCMFRRFSRLCDYGLRPAKLLCPRDSPGKNTGLGCHAFLQGIFPTQGMNPCLLRVLHCRPILPHWATWEAREPLPYRIAQNHWRSIEATFVNWRLLIIYYSTSYRNSLSATSKSPIIWTQSAPPHHASGHSPTHSLKLRPTFIFSEKALKATQCYPVTLSVHSRSLQPITQPRRRHVFAFTSIIILESAFIEVTDQLSLVYEDNSGQSS